MRKTLPFLIATLVLVVVTGAALTFLAQASRAVAGEQRFIDSVTTPLMQQVGTIQQAERAGYMKMTDLGSDGTAIYFNHHYDNVDPRHPNFLWFDRHGRLAGLDYEIPVSASHTAPSASIFPVSASRWTTVEEHVHFAYMQDGRMKLKEAEDADLRSQPITAKLLSKDRLLPAGATLRWVSYHPRCWDLGFWLVPNPLGSFAEYNPYMYL